MIDTHFWSDKRVLVTGHTGFKGSWLSLWLTNLGANVYGLGLQPDTNPSLAEGLQLHELLTSHRIIDLRDSASLMPAVADCQPDIVFHLAAQPLVRRSYIDPIQTWSTNVLGSLNLLEALKPLDRKCAVIMITTDKVYDNQDWDYGYRENDQLGGHDPYSASKAAMELAISSWRSSFCGSGLLKTPHLAIATARAGNVIGGGDWAQDRIIPDAIRCLTLGRPISVRQPLSTRPWQHVLEPISGYLMLAEKLYQSTDAFAGAFNFGPYLEANRTVRDLIENVLLYWSGSWIDVSDPSQPHEASRLHLQIDKAYHKLGWTPRWSFATTVERTISWYRSVYEGSTPLASCLADLRTYEASIHHNLSSSFSS